MATRNKNPAEKQTLNRTAIAKRASQRVAKAPVKAAKPRKAMPKQLAAKTKVKSSAAKGATKRITPKARSTAISAKQLSNPFSTGGGGGHFEAHVQASFVTLMLTGGFAPGLPTWPIVEVKLQGKVDGFETDDLIVSAKNPETGEIRRLVGQVKHSLPITLGNNVLEEVIQAAWKDFNNAKLFSKDKDVLALITGPLSSTDYHNVTWLLNQARHTNSAAEFLRNVSTAKFSPSKAQEKLDVLRHHLKVANCGVTLNDSEVYSFLRCYRLFGYDLGTEVGVALSLLHSHLSQVHEAVPEHVWGRVVDVVQTWNQSGGTLTLERLPEDLTKSLRAPRVAHIPANLAPGEVEASPTMWATTINWATHGNADELAVAALVGSWDENRPADKAVIERLTARSYNEWVKGLRSLLVVTGSPLKFKNGVWEAADRAGLLQAIGTRVFDPLLDSFQQEAVTVLTETDPAFDLSADERLLAGMLGKVLLHSGSLRIGVANGLAILGARPDFFGNASTAKPETVAALAVRNILDGASSKLWGTLNDVLPGLAEAAPNEFLRSVESGIEQSPSPFDELFSQEGDGIEGRNYMAGLLWALELISWDEELLVRACVALTELAARDPGGRWSNRPSHSLTTILLPWLPQTRASIAKRKVAVEVVCKEQMQVGWKLLLSLLPNQHQTTSGSYRPKWRHPVADMDESKPTQGEYVEQVNAYSMLAIALANSDVGRLSELVDRLGDLPSAAAQALLALLESVPIISMPEENRAGLWKRLTDFATKHRKYSGAAWAMSSDQVATVESVRDKLKPVEPALKYQRLFGENDFDLYDDRGNWEEQAKALQARRNDATREIWKAGGISSVISFAESVESPRKVGHALGFVGDSKTDHDLLPMGFEGTRKASQLGEAYVWARHRTGGWKWADSLDRSGWSTEHMARFLASLPFTLETWVRADKWLGKSRAQYWISVYANPFEADGKESNLEYAVKELLAVGRPGAAIECLYKMANSQERFSPELAIQALLDGVSSEEAKRPLQRHYIVDVIRAIQSDPQSNRDALAKVEWAYLRLLGSHEEVRPIELERRLSSDAAYFCEVINAVYRPESERGKPKRELTESEKNIAGNAWRLLHEWRTVPGVSADGKVNEAEFNAWLRAVKEGAAKSGRLSAALEHVGELLVHAPADTTGLWIDKTFAEALNERGAEKVREGFSVAIFNSRGAHWVDPSGAEDRKLVETYSSMADAVENAGYHRLAATVREIAASYAREAQRNVDEANRD